MHFLALMGLSLTGAVAATMLAVRALRRAGGRTWRRRAALLAGSGAVSLYVGGLLHVTGAVMSAEDGGTSSAPIALCRAAAGDDIATRVAGYDVHYVWPGFDCLLSDGGRYTTSAVPGYLNPAAAFLAVTALVLARRSASPAAPPTGMINQQDRSR